MTKATLLKLLRAIPLHTAYTLNEWRITRAEKAWRLERVDGTLFLYEGNTVRWIAGHVSYIAHRILSLR